MEKFSERIKSLRKDKGLTLMELSEKIGVSHAAIGFWETGKKLPSLESLVKIANYFNVTTDYLLGRTDY